MSEESPWGAPPPSQSYGPPPSPFPTGPTQPPANQPGGGQWGPPPSYGGPQGPYGRPPRRNTGAIIATVVAVLVVAAAIVVTLVVKSGGDDTATDDPTTSLSDSPATSDTPSSPETSETSGPPETSSAPPVDVPAGAVEGQKGGYYYELPGKAWNDAFDEASKQGLGATLDSFIILGTSIPLSQSNILTEALSAGIATTPEDLEEQWKRNLSGGDDAVPQDVADITIDGEHAIGVKFVDRVNDQDVMFNQRAYLVLHDGNQYSILLSYPSNGDFVSEDDFDTMLASWRWTS